MASKENIYFLRSFLLLIEGGLYISKEILSRECQKSENDLDELLKINERKLKHLFHDKQYKKLFPEFGKADINSWDLQLSVGVLINVFGKYLKSGEKVKLKLLRDIRNDIYMHCTTAALDESKYEDLREDLDDIITTLAATFDISVQQRCSNCITQYTTGPLDAVRPSSQTLNGLSQSCQKKIKVGVETELVIGGPSANWISLCEHTLDTILNHAESMTSEDGGFQEIEENVKKMLSYLVSNIEAVFKGSNMKCIILYFECKDYESFLSFLDKVESQEYTSYLRDLSNSLHSFFKPSYPISITSKVTSESLQSVLIDIIKTLSNEEEERRHVVEVSYEDNIHENMAISTASHDVHKEKQLINQSETSLFLNLELQSEEALPQMLQSFHGKQFSDSLKKVADSLSRHHGGDITLKASMDVGAMLEALEDSVSSAVTVAKETKTPESIYAMTSKDDLHSLSGVMLEPLEKSVSSDVTVAKGTSTTESTYEMASKDDLHSLSDDEGAFLADKVRIMKSAKYLITECEPDDIAKHLYMYNLLTSEDYDRLTFSHSPRRRKANELISLVLTGPKELLKGFKQSLHELEYDYINEMIDSIKVTSNDLKVLSELERSRQSCGKPLIKFTNQQRDSFLQEIGDVCSIAESLLSFMIISGKELLVISHQPTRREGMTVLLDILEQCSEKQLVDFFCLALKEIGFSHALMGIQQENRLVLRKKDSEKKVETILRKRQEIKIRQVLQQDEYQHLKTKAQERHSREVVNPFEFTDFKELELLESTLPHDKHKRFITKAQERHSREVFNPFEFTDQDIKKLELLESKLQQDKHKLSITKETIEESVATAVDIPDELYKTTDSGTASECSELSYSLDSSSETE